MSSLPHLVVRAEASQIIGTGHVMRMLALAQAWQDAGGRASFLFSQPNEPMRRRLEQENCQVIEMGTSFASTNEAAIVADFAKQEQASWLAVDGYNFNQLYLEILNKVGVPLLLTTDYVQAEHFPVDALLNQNPHARAEDYAKRAAGARLFLGLHYVLLRREFRQWAERRPKRTGKISRILITFGGADPHGVTGRVVRSLTGTIPTDIEIKVLVGGNNPRGTVIREATMLAGAQFECLDQVIDMPTLLTTCDLAICAAGATCWEMAFMGIPMLAIILAENQVPLAAAIERLGCGINLGWHHQFLDTEMVGSMKSLVNDPERAASMSQSGQALVDGNGATRVVDCLWSGKA